MVQLESVQAAAGLGMSEGEQNYRSFFSQEGSNPKS